MAKFFVGQRVRLARCFNEKLMCLVGKEATLIGVCNLTNHKSWWIDIPMPFSYSWSESGLDPLVNPDELAWQAFKKLHLTPDPSLILAKEPVKCSP